MYKNRVVCNSQLQQKLTYLFQFFNDLQHFNDLKPLHPFPLRRKLQSYIRGPLDEQTSPHGGVDPRKLQLSKRSEFDANNYTNLNFTSNVSY